MMKKGKTLPALAAAGKGVGAVGYRTYRQEDRDGVVSANCTKICSLEMAVESGCARVVLCAGMAVDENRRERNDSPRLLWVGMWLNGNHLGPHRDSSGKQDKTTDIDAVDKEATQRNHQKACVRDDYAGCHITRHIK